MEAKWNIPKRGKVERDRSRDRAESGRNYVVTDADEPPTPRGTWAMVILVLALAGTLIYLALK